MRSILNLAQTDIDFQTGAHSLDLNQAFLKLSKKSNRKTNRRMFQ
ncbi:hypothetical protein EV143_10273 [Flavobacterium chryseum]|nr:hypothetical protein EV143_10273 [Flavobacterium sp. P3160]